MASLEQKITLLATIYGRHPYEVDGRYGFFSRDDFSDLYDTLEEAIAAEATRIRTSIITYQGDIEGLRDQMNNRLTHLGILEL